MDINKLRNSFNNLIDWEWNTLKKLRRKRRRNYLLRGSFAIFSLASVLFCVFAPPFILGSLFTALGAPWPFVNWVELISFFAWLWFIVPMSRLSRKEIKQKKEQKAESVKAVKNAFDLYQKNKKRLNK